MKQLSQLFNIHFILFWTAYVLVNAIIIAAGLIMENYWLWSISIVISVATFIYHRYDSKKVIDEYLHSKKGLKSKSFN